MIRVTFSLSGKGRIVWGVCYKDTRECGGTTVGAGAETNTILMSAAEKPEVAEKIQGLGWEVKSEPGAGYKLLKVALGMYDQIFFTQKKAEVAKSMELRMGSN